jgi:hypothetical protein
VDGHDPQEVVARVVQHCATPLDLKAGYALAKARRPNYPVKGLFT